MRKFFFLEEKKSSGCSGYSASVWIKLFPPHLFWIIFIQLLHLAFLSFHGKSKNNNNHDDDDDGDGDGDSKQWLKLMDINSLMMKI